MVEYVTREEYDELKAEVEQLKDQLQDSNNTESGIPGLDHRDETVLKYIKENGDPGPMGTLKLYQQLTDVTKHKTAKTRAENLRGHPEFDA